jgi:hypothetical protein
MNTKKQYVEIYSKSILTCPVPKPTTRSAMKESSVSPLRWLTITAQPAPRAKLHLEAKQMHIKINDKLNKSNLRRYGFSNRTNLIDFE